MRTRIITSLAALPILFLALYLRPAWILPAMLTFVSGLAAWELLHTAGFARHPLLLTEGILGAALACIWGCTGMDSRLFVFGVLTLGILSFLPGFGARRADALEGKPKDGSTRTGYAQQGCAVFTAIFLGLAFSCLCRIKQGENGVYLVLLPFLFAWETDICAYFAGKFLGKRKFTPIISPKKTWAGAVGGVIGCVLFSLVYGIVLRRGFGMELTLWKPAAMAVPASCIAQLGDLSLSCVKREAGIKDYGRIMPGHGGILDRFDSVLFTAPVTELVLWLAGGIL